MGAFRGVFPRYTISYCDPCQVLSLLAIIYLTNSFSALINVTLPLVT
jgi:hypothetical protein